MELTVTIPSRVEEHLRAYAASLFYETTPSAISRAIVCALINQLDTACVVSRDEIVTEILEASQPPAPQPAPTPVVEKESPAPPTEKANGTPPVTVLRDTKQLKVPSEQFQGHASNTWLVWGWCMASSLNLGTVESGAGKFHSFNLQEVIQGVMQKKRVHVKDTTAYSALGVLVKRQWLTFNAATKLYASSPVAQKWVLTPKNQTYLIN